MTQQKAGSPAAAAVVWQPVPRPEQQARAAQAARARRRGARQAVLAGAVAALLFVLWSQVMAGVVAGLALAVLACSWWSPTGIYAHIESALETFGRWTGELLSFVSLTLIFYSIFLPFGVLFRRGKRDPMKRRYDPHAPSYWEPREPAADDSQRHQF